MNATGVFEQRIENMEAELAEIENNITKLGFANKLKSPVSKFIWKASMIENLDKAEVLSLKPIAQKYWNKKIEISKTRAKLIDFLVKENDKELKTLGTKDLQHPKDENEKQDMILKLKYNIKRCDEWVEILRHQLSLIDNDNIEPEDSSIIDLLDENINQVAVINDFKYDNEFFNQDSNIKKVVWQNYFKIPEDERQGIQFYYESWKDTDEANQLLQVVREKRIANMAEFENSVRNSRR